MAVGDQQNYNLDSGNYTLLPGASIQQVSGESPRFEALVSVAESPSGNHIAFRSDHAQYRDAEEAIAVVREAMTASNSGRGLGNVFAETVNEYSGEWDGRSVLIIETKVRVWSFYFSVS